MKARGLQPGAQVIRLVLIESALLAMQALQLAPGEKIVLLERLHLAGGEP